MELDEAIMIVDTSVNVNKLQVKAGMIENEGQTKRLFTALEALVKFAKNMKAKHVVLDSLDGS